MNDKKEGIRNTYKVICVFYIIIYVNMIFIIFTYVSFAYTSHIILYKMAYVLLPVFLCTLKVLYMLLKA
jgi:hypothetical protein